MEYKWVRSNEWIRRKLELKKLVQDLKDHDQIEFIYSSYYYIIVQFKATGIIEFWALNNDCKRKKRCYKLPRGPFFNGNLDNKPQFETNPLYPDDVKILKDYFVVNQKEFKQAGWCAQRLKLHTLAADLANAGFIRIQYTRPILNKSLSNLLEEDLDRYQFSPIRFGVRPNNIVFRRIVDHFEQPSDRIIETWSDPVKLFRAVKYVSEYKRKAFSRENIFRHANGALVNPNFYRSWFRNIDLNGKKVLDMHPNGSRALAVMLNGGIYSSNKYSKMAEFVNAHQPVKYDRYDIAFLNGTKPQEFVDVKQLITEHRNIADILIVSTNYKAMQEMVSAYKPRRTLRISIRPPQNPAMDDYIFIIDQR